MELTIKNLKDKVIYYFGSILLEDGFVFKKSSFTYLKDDVVRKYKIEVSFFFYDFKPVNLSYNYSVTVYVKKIQQEQKRFLEFVKKEYSILPPTEHKNEIDFYKHLDFNQKCEIDKVYTLDNDDSIKSRSLLMREKVSYLISMYQDLKLYQNFVLDNVEEIDKSLNIFSALIAIKLKDIDSLKKVVDYLISTGNPDYLEPNPNSMRYLIVQNIIPWALSEQKSS